MWLADTEPPGRRRGRRRPVHMVGGCGLIIMGDGGAAKGNSKLQGCDDRKKGLLEKPLANTAPSKHVPGLHGDHGSWQLDAARSLHKLATWIAATGKTLPPRSWNSFCWTDAGRCKLRCAAYLTASSSLDQGPSRKASHTKKKQTEKKQGRPRAGQRSGRASKQPPSSRQHKTRQTGFVRAVPGLWPRSWMFQGSSNWDVCRKFRREHEGH